MEGKQCGLALGGVCGAGSLIVALGICSRVVWPQTLRGFKAVAHICDTFVFAYIGISVGLATRASMQWSMGLILLTIALCIVVRAMHVFPLLFLANRYREETVKPNMQSALWLAGLRGPVCFMVSSNNPPDCLDAIPPVAGCRSRWSRAAV